MRIIFNFTNLRPIHTIFTCTGFNGTSQCCVVSNCLTRKTTVNWQLTIKPTLRAPFQLQNLLLPLSPNASPIYESAPNLSYLQTNIHGSSKARPAGKQSHSSKGGSASFPGPQASRHSPAHCSQFHRELSTVKLKVWGRSTTKPSLWKWAVRVLTEHLALAFGTSWQYPKAWHMCFKF